MKKNKITGQQLKFIINMISITIFAVAYLYVYTGYMKKTEAAYNEIDSTKQSIEELNTQLSEEETVLQEMEEVNNQMQTIIDSFPVDIAKEDNLLFIEQMQKVLNIKFTSINVTDSTPVYETILPIRNEDGTEVDQMIRNATSNNIAASTNTTLASINSEDNTSTNTDKQTASLEETDGTIAEGTENSNTTVGQTGTNIATETTTATQLQVMQGTQSSITMNFGATYKEFKKLVDYIANYPDKTVIDSVSVSYDNTTGNLTGSLVLKRFALTGTGKVYQIPMIEDINIGTDNIFGTDTDKKDDESSVDKQSETLPE
jgi:hypothetical protein